MLTAKKLTVGSLFAGIGGFDLAAERAGLEVKWQVEIDDYATRVLDKHWPGATRYRDIRAVNWADVEPVDVLCGGFPCQPHSTAGKRLASADERDLWGEFVRCIRAVRPRWVVAENVAGLLSSEAGRFFGRVLRELAESGYDAEWDCIPASAVGAPHQRDRVWIVAYPAELHSDGGGVYREHASGEVPEPGDGRGASGVLAYAVCERGASGLSGPESRQEGDAAFSIYGGASMGCADVTSADAFAAAGRPRATVSESGWWASEPDVGRVAHGVPARVDRLRGLGNAIVPQVAEWIFRRIIEAEQA
jgi:DNA (cytosine-5)-methyltransferase 1